MTNIYTLNFFSSKPLIEATFTAEASNELDALKIIYADAENILYDCNDDMNFKQFVEWVNERHNHPTIEQSIQFGPTIKPVAIFLDRETVQYVREAYHGDPLESREDWQKLVKEVLMEYFNG
jgi:hypothetical protein